MAWRYYQYRRGSTPKPLGLFSSCRFAIIGSMNQSIELNKCPDSKPDREQKTKAESEILTLLLISKMKKLPSKSIYRSGVEFRIMDFHPRFCKPYLTNAQYARSCELPLI
jgi:hypothetical protein